MKNNVIWILVDAIRNYHSVGDELGRLPDVVHLVGAFTFCGCMLAVSNFEIGNNIGLSGECIAGCVSSLCQILASSRLTLLESMLDFWT